MTAALATTGLTADEARSLERTFLTGLNEAEAAFERILATQAWTQLGHETFADWWNAAVQPAMRALSLRPQPALAAAVVDQVRAEEASLPSAQRRTQKELAEMAGVDQKTVSNWSRSTPQESSSKVDLEHGDTQTPEPAADLSAAQVGSGPAPDGPPPSPGADPAPAAEPAPRREPDPTPGPDLTAKIREDLAEIGAEGTTLSAIGHGFRRGEVADADLASAMGELLTSGEVSIVGESIAGTLFALTELVDAAPSAEPTPPPSRFALTAEQRQQIADEAERVRSIDNARRKADRLVREVSGLITEIEAGVLLGEPGLVTTDMVAGLRAEADRLEKYLKENA